MYLPEPLEVPGWSMNLILFCGGSSAPLLAAVCHRMAKPLLQDARFFGAKKRGNLSIGRLGGCTRMVYLLKCTSSEVSLMYGNLLFLLFYYLLIFNRYIYWIHYYPSTMKTIIFHFSLFNPPPKKKCRSGNCPPSFVKSCRKIGRVGASGGLFGLLYNHPSREDGSPLGSRHDCGSVTKTLGDKKLFSPGNFGVKPLFRVNCQSLQIGVVKG